MDFKGFIIKFAPLFEKILFNDKSGTFHLSISSCSEDLNNFFDINTLNNA